MPALSSPGDRSEYPNAFAYCELAGGYHGRDYNASGLYYYLCTRRHDLLFEHYNWDPVSILESGGLKQDDKQGDGKDPPLFGQLRTIHLGQFLCMMYATPLPHGFLA